MTEKNWTIETSLPVKYTIIKSDGIFADLDAATTSDVVYFNSGTGEMTYGAAPSGTVSFGTDKQMPYMNAAGTDFDYGGIEFEDLGGSGSFLSLHNTAAAELQFFHGSTDWFALSAYSGSFARFSFYGQSVLTLNPNGSIVFDDYGSGNNTGTAAYNLEVDASGNIIETTAGSDLRLKENFRTLNNSLDKILNINTYAFDWKKDIPKKAEDEAFDIKIVNDTKQRESAGVIAQEIQKIIPESVKQYNNGYYKVDYEVIVPHLIEAIKDLQKQINNLK